jgi:hypothetical protein
MPRPIRCSGRVHTLPLPLSATIDRMSAILGHPQVRQLPVGGERQSVSPGRRPATLLRRRAGGHVVALRQRDVVSLGSLRERTLLDGELLVTATDAAHHCWWIPAEAVWSDAATNGCPEHPRPIGLAMATTRDAALVKGLSDRLGWEAVLEFERGRDLPPIDISLATAGEGIGLDGRLGHDIPTVVVLGANTIRWGAASTWDGAVRRALYGDDHDVDPATELVLLAELLVKAGLEVATVDLGSPRLAAAGVVRCSAQLLAGNGSVRSWDARPLN